MLKQAYFWKSINFWKLIFSRATTMAFFLIFETYASQRPYLFENTSSGLKHTLQMANMWMWKIVLMKWEII